MISKRNLLEFFAIIFLTTNCFAQTEAPSFDEIHVLRDQYANPVTIFQQFSPNRLAQIRESTLASLSGISAVHPLPYVLSDEENRVIRKGAYQISNAVRLFFEDHFSGRRTYVHQNIIPQEVMAAILSSYPHIPLDRKIISGSTALVVGPDIVRTPEGFRLLEINVAGWMGGISTTSRLVPALLQAAPEYSDLFKKSARAESFYDNLANYYKILLGAEQVGVVIAAETSNALEVGLAKHGFTILSDGTKLEFRDGKIFLETQTGTKQVGFIYLDMKASSLPSTPWGKEIVEAYFSGQVKLSTPPQAEILMDKRFIPYISRMIEFYLNEKPIIPAPRTEILTLEKFEKLLPEIKNYVIKFAIGVGGEEVFMGPEIAEDLNLVQHIREKLSSESAVSAIVQQMATIGTRAGVQADIRPITYVDSQVTLTSPLPWSRSAAVGKKSNITGRFGSSTQNAVLILAPNCSDLFK